MSERLRIGLLQCGYLHPDVAADLGDYPELFASLLARFDVDLITYDVQRAPLPAGPAECDGWLVSGSASSAYDDEPWIPPLESFLRDLVDADVALVAICFGHQLLAQALGGKVARSPDGWGVGVHGYQLTGPPTFEPVPPSGVVRIIASHQDQVVDLPAGAEVVALTEHCAVAAYTIGPRVLAIQPHPEFTPEISRALMQLRRERIGDATTDAGLASLDEPVDRDLVAGWMHDVWRRAGAR